VADGADLWRRPFPEPSARRHLARGEGGRDGRGD